MKELLHIPTGNIITFLDRKSVDYSFVDTYRSFGEIYTEDRVEKEIRRIASGEYCMDFYSWNNIPRLSSPAEYLVIDI